MSSDKHSQFYCLTETGWALIEEGSAPDGWVRICELKVYQGSSYGRESRTWQEPKTHPDWTAAAAPPENRRSRVLARLMDAALASRLSNLSAQLEAVQ